jgi:hypothetical protein
MAVIQMSDRELTRLRVLIDVMDGRLTRLSGFDPEKPEFGLDAV